MKDLDLQKARYNIILIQLVICILTAPFGILSVLNGDFRTALITLFICVVTLLQVSLFEHVTKNKK